MAILAEIKARLKSLSSSIGIDFEELTRDEDCSNVRFIASKLPLNRIRNLDIEAVRELRTALGDSLKMVVRDGDFQSFSIGDVTWEIDWKKLQQMSQPESVSFELLIDKNRFLKHVCLDTSNYQSLSLFLSEKSFLRWLEGNRSNFTTLESSLWKKGQTTKAIVVVCGLESVATGNHLAVISEQDSALQETLNKPPTETLERALTIAKTASESIRWESDWIQFLTPGFFDCNVSQKGTKLDRMLVSVSCGLALLYSADRITKLNDGLHGFYHVENFEAEIASISPTEEIDSEKGHRFVRLVEWTHEDRWQSDRAKLLKSSLARAFESDGKARSLTELLSRIDRIESDVHWRWTTFLEGKVKDYLDEEIDLEKEVANTVDGFENQISTMIAGLSTTVLAAVGAFIGSVMIAIFKEPFNTRMFGLGLVVYLCYLVIFPGIYVMLHHWSRVVTVRAIFDGRRQRFERLLGTSTCNAIVSDKVQLAESKFWRWYWATIVAMLVVVVAVVIGYVYVPTGLQNVPKP